MRLAGRELDIAALDSSESSLPYFTLQHAFTSVVFSTVILFWSVDSCNKKHWITTLQNHKACGIIVLAEMFVGKLKEIFKPAS